MPDPFQFERPCWIHGVKEVLLNAVTMWEWRQDRNTSYMPERITGERYFVRCECGYLLARGMSSDYDTKCPSCGVPVHVEKFDAETK